MKSKNEEQKRKRKVTQKRTFIRGNEKRIKIKKKKRRKSSVQQNELEKGKKNLKTKLGKTKSKKKM